jgi:RES domain-containing protein
MELYRLTKSKYENDLSGTGAFLAGGRWNNRGTYLLYTAASRSLAVVEALVHLVTVKNTERYSMLVLYVPDDVARTIYTNSILNPDWKNNPSYTQAVGDLWAKQKSSLLLQIPSAIISKEYNFLINPLHPQAKLVKVMEFEPFSFDVRLKNE